jgi:replicative DNA helicase
MTSNSQDYEMTMPVNHDAERTILAAILLDNENFDLAERINVYDFSLDSHRRIFAAMAALLSDGHPVDIITLSEKLRQGTELEVIGGVAYLAQLTEGVPRRIAIDEYVRIVKDKSQLRSLIHSCSHIITGAQDRGADLDTLLADADMRILEIAAEDRGEQETLAEASVRAFKQLLVDRDSKEQYIGIPSGLDALDEITGGYVEGELTVIGGRPGQGKSSKLIQALIQCGKNKIPTHLFSLEMTKDQVLRRMWSAVSGVAFARVRNPKPDSLDLQQLLRVESAVDVVAQFPLEIEDEANYSISQIVSKARISKRRKKTRLIGLDYLQKLHFDVKPEHKSVAVADATVKLATLAKTDHMAVIALSSLTEKTGRSRNIAPVLADLRQSGDIQYEASTVLFIHREVDESTEKIKNDGEIIIAKQRSGDTGKLPVQYNNRLMFETISGEKEKQPVNKQMALGGM